VLSTSPNRPNRASGVSRGFSLIELMIVLAIVAILATIAYASYSRQMQHGRRSSAEATLMDIAQRQQQYLLDARSYAPDATTLNVTIPTEVSTYYTMTIVTAAGPPPTFTATATPIAGSAQAGDVTLSIDNTGAQTPASSW
jgi:type IV pilus assembly protein PilE